MRIDEAFNWINRKAVPIALLVLLLGAGVFAHRMAIGRLAMTHGRLARMDAVSSQWRRVGEPCR
jgi:hypothetical protein